MKQLVIPEKTPFTIFISDIDNDFNGLIIAYRTNFPVGYFQYYEDEELWTYLKTTNISSYIPELSSKNLIDVIKKGIAEKYFDEVRVLEMQSF